MNKIDIIQRLLDERHITAKEALVLMEKEYGQFQYWPYYPVIPQPIGPIYCGDGQYIDRTQFVVTSEN